jgi:Zn-dependent protease with chaperone function
MDFFEHQERARKRTTTLVIYFGLAVFLIILSVYFVFSLFVLRPDRAAGADSLRVWWDPRLFAWVAGGTISLVGLGSLYKVASLSSGGATIARSLGGRLIQRNTADPQERKLLNVVEEMAIAAGTPVPPVYLLEEEEGINAFAAGFTPDDAVIGVTRGCMELLNRDELQGVIAHEFSHILNGDMRLNLRLVGVLFGILLIALIGRGIMRSAGMSRRKKGGGGAVLLGLALLLIGYIGVFFGNLIKSAVSRQREYLADAASVQFTRNPSGIAGALKKIGGLAQGATISHANAEEASHLFFGNALGSSLFDLFATHPPLVDRIRRIDPSFDGRFPSSQAILAQRAVEDTGRRQAPARPKAAGAPAVSSFADHAAPTVELEPGRFTSQVGAPDPGHIAYASALIFDLPPELAELVRDPWGAHTAIYALLLNDDPQAQSAQLRYLSEQCPQAIGDQIRKVFPVVRQLPPQARLPLIEMALPALHNLSENQYRLFKETIQQLVVADRKVTLFEYAIQRIVVEHLDRQFGAKRAGAAYYSMRPLLPACAGLLSTLAHAGNRDDGQAQRAFAAGLGPLGSEAAGTAMLPRTSCGPAAMDQALDRLSAASSQIKKRVLQACAACASADRKITVEEGELLRVIGHSLGCPIPPLLTRDAAA